MKSHTIKRVLSTLLLCTIAFGVNAQNKSGIAQQSVVMPLTGAFDITFTSNNSNIGNIVNLAFTNTSDYISGVESAGQTLRVRTNTDFDIMVNAANEYFTYAGNATSNTNMKVEDVLEMKVLNNNTGGTITAGFSNYKELKDNERKIINKGDPGGNQTFDVQYKATPGFGYPAGIYSVDVIFTLTEH